MSASPETARPLFIPDAYSEDGVDLTLIRWMLSMTPMERLETLENFANEIIEMRHVIATQQTSRHAGRGK